MPSPPGSTEPDRALRTRSQRRTTSRRSSRVWRACSGGGVPLWGAGQTTHRMKVSRTFLVGEPSTSLVAEDTRTVVRSRERKGGISNGSDHDTPSTPRAHPNAVDYRRGGLRGTCRLPARDRPRGAVRQGVVGRIEPRRASHRASGCKWRCGWRLPCSRRSSSWAAGESPSRRSQVGWCGGGPGSSQASPRLVRS
jgi:hypothetical protein